MADLRVEGKQMPVDGEHWRSHVFTTGLFLVAAVLSPLAALFNWHWGISAFLVTLLVMYLLSLLSNAVKRRDRKEGTNFPDFGLMLFQLLFFIVVAVSAYANLYKASGGIRTENNEITLPYGAPVTENTPAESRDKERPIYLTTTQAFYLSTATISTLGYGDLVPITSLSRWLAIAEVATGLLILICVFPITLSRLGTFE
jgi:Ion channel